MRIRYAGFFRSLGLALLAACASEVNGEAEVRGVPAPLEGEIATGSAADEHGRALFETALPDTNGRACGTCHIESSHLALKPSDVEAAAPYDPLFHPIDADDPNAADPTYAHLRLGLVRVTLKLPDNMDLINEDGSQVVTAPDRMYSVWRGVPTIENTFFTAPYQYDGRFSTLQLQAQGAITAHSQGPQQPWEVLDAIAQFESTIYSSDRAAFVAQQVAAGVPTDQLQNPEDSDLSHGNELYEKACKGCHGGAKDNTITNRAMIEVGFNAFSTYALSGETPVTGGAGPVVLKPDGNVLFQQLPDPADPTQSVVVSRSNPQRDDEFLNIGFGFFSYLGQEGVFPTFNAGVPLPRYRFRFYTDATRCEPVVDLPPIPVFDPAGPLVAARDENGLPIVGPNFLPQKYSTDPGRAGITGNPADFEGMKVPQLRGLAQTAPYFHDNSFATLKDVVDAYSRFVIPLIPAVGLPGVFPPEPNGPGLPEALSPEDKADLIAFLETF